MTDNLALDTAPVSALAVALAYIRIGQAPAQEAITTACASDGPDPALQLGELVTAASKIKTRPELRAAIHSVATLTAIREVMQYQQASFARSKPDREATRQKLLNWRIPERKAEHAVRMKPLVEAKKQFPGRTYEIPLTMEPMLPTVRRSPTDKFLR